MLFIALLTRRPKKTAPPKKQKKKEEISTDHSGFQSVPRRTSRRNDGASADDVSPPDDGMDDIQRFRAQMKEQEVSVNGQSFVSPSAPIQSANLFDLLDNQDEDIFTQTVEDGSKSKFSKLFSEQTEIENKEYDKVVEMLSNSLKQTTVNDDTSASAITQATAQAQVNAAKQTKDIKKKIEEDEDDINPLAALLNSSIKSKKGKAN